MTIREAIEMVDRLKPNQYPLAQKIEWLSMLDGMIYDEIIGTHEWYFLPSVKHGRVGPLDAPGDPAPCHPRGHHPHRPTQFYGYKAGCDPDTQLLVPYPYDRDIYNFFLQSRIDLENGEIGKYNQTNAMYEDAFSRYADYVNRTRMPRVRAPFIRF